MMSMPISLTILLTLQLAFLLTAATENGSCMIELAKNPQASRIQPILEKYKAALLMLLGFGGLSVVLAIIYNSIRKYIFHDAHSLDTSFDAGGRVTLSLTVVTVTSQLLWPADFLQISTLVSKSGIGAALWFSLGIVLNILLFPLLSLHLKTRAPGAKTFLQIIYARFGKPAHIVFCIIALLANMMTIMSLILAAKAALDVLVKDISEEFVVLILAVLFGSYCVIGGLGTTFYISYFNTALTFVSLLIFIINVNYLQVTEKTVLTSQESMYNAMKCIKGPDGNYNNSLLTFRSRSGIIYGLVLFFMATSLSFCDQANWQSRIAAKPTQGVLGFIITAYIWFSIPMAIALTASMSYMSMSYNNATHLLTDFDIDSGFITPYVMEETMGSAGAYLLITAITMALMSTGSGEVMAVSSILVYDIYKTYINPFRKTDTPTCCQLCGKEKVMTPVNKKSEEVPRLCACISAEDCKDCVDDVTLISEGKQTYNLKYNCAIHGLYRHYEDLLIDRKGWCIVWVTIAIVPYGLIIISSGVNLNWAVFTMQSLMSPFLAPLLLTIAWSKSTSAGVIAGSISGLIAAIAGILIVAGTVYPDLKNNFMKNTSADYSLLAGTVSGLVISLLVTMVVSIATNKITNSEESDREWEKTVSIDNPLNSWKRLYKEELSFVSTGTRITSHHMAKIFRSARLVAYIGGGLSFFLFIAVFPGIMLGFEILSYEQFSGFVTFTQVWCMIAAAFAIIAPPVEEIIQILREYNKNKKEENIKTDVAFQNNSHHEQSSRL